jgi:hypothetical protein
MAEADPRLPDNMRVWSRLAKSDPKQTKQFKRAGGFSGTALKPMWVIQRLTEVFGPCGEGWGVDEPTFQVVAGDNREVLVFCTVSGWHGSRENRVYGVGGDKVVSYVKANEQYKRPERWENDDEAFKKAFTDAVGNAFKFIGVGADIHMGQFDDSKYVAQMEREFAQQAEQEKSATRTKLEGPYTSKTALWAAVKAFDREVRSCGDIDQLDALLGTAETKALLEQCGRDAPQLLDTGEGLPAEFVPINKLIAMFRAELESQANQGWQNNPLNGG